MTLVGFELETFKSGVKLSNSCANWAMRYMSNRCLKKKEVNAYKKMRDVGGDRPPPLRERLKENRRFSLEGS